MSEGTWTTFAYREGGRGHVQVVSVSEALRHEVDATAGLIWLIGTERTWCVPIASLVMARWDAPVETLVEQTLYGGAEDGV